MSILRSIKKIIKYRGLFGPTVVPLGWFFFFIILCIITYPINVGINIMATFIHNEPTSLAIIQEAGLPEAFYAAIEAGLEPAIEVYSLSSYSALRVPYSTFLQVIQAIPNAIGALCLNDTGTAQLASHPSILPAIFSIFTSDRHLKVLLDKENAVLIGTTIDELIRHHPSLKTPVFDALKATLSKIEALGTAYVVPEELQQWYKLVGITPGAEPDVSMEDVPTDAASPSDTAPKEDVGPHSGDDTPAKAHDNNVVSFIDILLRVSLPYVAFSNC
jgi:E3 ubiquitin-protein ligase HUWE1